MTKDDRLASALADDYRTAPIGDADRAMLTYVDKLTRTPAAIVADDVEALRKVGFSDAAILDICQVAAYYAFVNRLADGLGIELESKPGPT
ncbi:MAG: hypothetical protein JSU86_01305 [Phycisphaerales bacterium]|nr:MAG: hypothetical protein JSU86_01305 [Phycisphaerales bacterium]